MKWVDVSMGTTCTGAHVPVKQVFVVSPSIMGGSVQSSKILFIELLCIPTLDMKYSMS